MAGSADIVLRHIRALTVIENAHHLPDRQLLERFAAAQEETAFAALVRRHGPLVLGVCRRVLHQEQDAEDVFQATFLTLARKADSAGRQASLGTWLYQVAYHLALKVRRQAAARHKREARSASREAVDPLAEVNGRELLAVLDEELQALPGSERLALVLCYLQSKTRDEAAREVGCSASTLKRRLERGKERMRLRLARRGVVLSAALLAAELAQGAAVAVPASLTNTAVKAGLLAINGQAVAGVVSAQAAALAARAVRATLSGKLKAVGALLVAVALMGIGSGLFASSPPAASEKGEPKAPPVVAQVKPAAEKEEMTVTGRVLDADGKPLSGAEIVVMAWPKEAQKGGDLSPTKAKQLGRDKTDTEGRFRLTVPRTTSARFPGVVALAGGAGHGVGWQQLNPDAEKPIAEIRLAPEQVIRGRFVDVQGQPAVGITVSIYSLSVGETEGIGLMPAGQEPSCWPKPAVTDKDGRYEIRGVGKGANARLAVGDERFAAQHFAITADAKEVLRTLEPAHIVEGTVTYSDTGKPVPGARLTVYAGKSQLDSMFGTDGKADEQGRFRLNPTPGNYLHLSAYAPDGKPYLTVQKQMSWPKAEIKQKVDFALPRGVLVRGTLTRAGSDKAVAKATVQFIPRQANNPNFRADALTGWQNTVVSGRDGRFDICVLPGPGHLLIHGPTLDYIFAEIGDNKLYQGKDGGRRYYAHAIVPLDLKPATETHDVTVTLKPAVTVKGRVIGPDGKPVAEALIVSRLNVDPLVSFWRGFPILVRDGRFELLGCDPEKTYPVSFLDAKHKAGATVELSGKKAGEEVTVRLAPCGTATTRLVDEDGKPIAKSNVWLELVVTPGAAQYDIKKVYEKGEMAGDADFVANIDHVNYRNGLLTDAEGRITFPALIPGATYRIVEVSDRDDMIKCEFKGESGKTIKLPDVVRKKQP